MNTNVKPNGRMSLAFVGCFDNNRKGPVIINSSRTPMNALGSYPASVASCELVMGFTASELYWDGGT
nr:unnamed protein product [Digitaria exilis]